MIARTLSWVGAVGLLVSPYIVCYTIWFATGNATASVVALIVATVLMFAVAFRNPGQHFISSLWEVVSGLVMLFGSLFVLVAFLSGIFSRSR